MRGPESYIFKAMVRVAFFIINLLALYLLLRGHNLPGGGFIGGLAAAISLVLLNLALGVQEMHRVLRVDPVRVAAGGLFLAAGTGLLPVAAGRPFLEHFNTHIHHVPFVGELHLGTPLLFDLGVFLVVVGVTTKIIFVLAKSTSGLRALVMEEEVRYSSPRETPIESEWTAAPEDAPSTPGKEASHAS